MLETLNLNACWASNVPLLGLSGHTPSIGLRTRPIRLGLDLSNTNGTPPLLTISFGLNASPMSRNTA